ncbi:hypothetical protein RJ55_08473 [Drechmeria coniospora]|nr:hypothetical protein RJ55_08473 [Drechmeria coniospora]
MSADKPGAKGNRIRNLSAQTCALIDPNPSAGRGHGGGNAQVGVVRSNANDMPTREHRAPARAWAEARIYSIGPVGRSTQPAIVCPPRRAADYAHAPLAPTAWFGWRRQGTDEPNHKYAAWASRGRTHHACFEDGTCCGETSAKKGRNAAGAGAGEERMARRIAHTRTCTYASEANKCKHRRARRILQ